MKCYRYTFYYHHHIHSYWSQWYPFMFNIISIYDIHMFSLQCCHFLLQLWKTLKPCFLFLFVCIFLLCSLPLYKWICEATVQKKLVLPSSFFRIMYWTHIITMSTSSFCFFWYQNIYTAVCINEWMKEIQKKK